MHNETKLSAFKSKRLTELKILIKVIPTELKVLSK